LKKQVPKAILKPGAVSVDYVNLDGNRMKFSFPDGRMLNGKKIDLSRYRLFEGPFVNAEVGSEKLSIKYKNLKRVLDFKALKILE